MRVAIADNLHVVNTFRATLKSPVVAELKKAVGGTVTGAAKYLPNTVSWAAGMVNAPIDRALGAAGVDFRFGTPPRFELDEFEESAQLGIDLSLTLLGAAKGVATVIQKLAVRSEAAAVSKSMLEYVSRSGPQTSTWFSQVLLARGMPKDEVDEAVFLLDALRRLTSRVDRPKLNALALKSPEEMVKALRSGW